MPTRPKTTEAKARKLFSERYAKSFLANDARFPQLRSGLMELARVEVQLDEVAKSLEQREEMILKGGGNYEEVITQEGKDGVLDQHTLMKIQQQLRQQQARIKKNLNLSLERREHMKAQTADGDDEEDVLEDCD